MGIFTRKMNAAKARKASLQERGPKNPFEYRILKSMVWAKIHLKAIYGIKIKKMPSVVVSARMLFADRGASSAHLKELSARGHAPSPLAPTEYSPCLAPELLIRTKMVYSALTNFPRATYHPEFQAIRVPPTYLMPPGALSQLEETIMHELIHHALWEQESPVYSLKKQWLYPGNFNPALKAANEGLASYLQYRKLPSSLKSKKEIAKSILKYPITLAKNTSCMLKTAVSRPFIPLFASAGALVSAATWLKKIASITLRNTVWRKPERFARAMHENPLSHYAVDEYSDGLEFVKKVAKEFINPETTFDVICRTPPSTYEEILMPERYLEKLRNLRPELFSRK
ncbi:hypothetical protein GF415_01445 [Candidatus Micrarchaeota archaeon]|nr:hypothetical protein [Candidatus Micrarchaeota archaeon]